MNITFAKKWQSGLDKDLLRRLQAASQQYGSGIHVLSGKRPKAYNARIGGAKKSFHITGRAADLDMSGMSDMQRTKLVNALRNQGVTGFGAYSKYPDMLHIDMRSKPHYMFNTTSRNMASAPDWFKTFAGVKSSAPQPVKTAQARVPLPRPPQGIDMEGSGLKSHFARAQVKADPDMDFQQLPGGRVKFSMNSDNLNMLDNIDQAMAPGRLRSPAPIVSGGTPVAPAPSMPNAPAAPPSPPPAPPVTPPSAPTMLANLGGSPLSIGPSPGASTPGLGGIFAALSGMAGQDDTAAQQQAQQQAHQAQLERMRWAMNNGFGRGLL